MAGIRLDGNALASVLEASQAARGADLHAAGQAPPSLAVLFAAADRRAAANADRKLAACQRTGMQCRLVAVLPDAGTAWVVAEIERLNADPLVHGVFLQYPLGAGFDERSCCERIAVAKDVDGAAAASLGAFALGAAGFAVATPAGILRLLAHHGIEVSGRRALVVGGPPLARPMALALLAADATVTACAPAVPAGAARLQALVERAEIVVAAAGQPEVIKSAWFADGAIVVDLGFHPAPPGGEALRPVGDVEMTSDLMRRCRAWTPVPGGAGPMTVAMLLEHTLAAAEAAASRDAGRRGRPAARRRARTTR